MATLRDYYNTGDDYFEAITENNLRAQTFTPSEAYSITSVKLKLSRFGSPGIIVVSIRAVDGTGKPTGSNLCSGTTDGDTLIESDVAGEWRETTFSSPYNLVSGTKYGIVVALQDTGLGGTNILNWWEDSTSATYAGGSSYYGWEPNDWYVLGSGNYDFMFETWGDDIAFRPQVIMF